MPPPNIAKNSWSVFSHCYKQKELGKIYGEPFSVYLFLLCVVTINKQKLDNFKGLCETLHAIKERIVWTKRDIVNKEKWLIPRTLESYKMILAQLSLSRIWFQQGALFCPQLDLLPHSWNTSHRLHPPTFVSGNIIVLLPNR